LWQTTWVWDTFAEPNNLYNTERSFQAKSGLIPIAIGTSPKKQDNRRRLRLTAAQNLSLWGSETPRQIQWFFSFDFSQKNSPDSIGAIFL